MFEERWALVTAGTLDDFNTCTVKLGQYGQRMGGLMAAIFPR